MRDERKAMLLAAENRQGEGARELSTDSHETNNGELARKRWYSHEELYPFPVNRLAWTSEFGEEGVKTGRKWQEMEKQATAETDLLGQDRFVGRVSDPRINGINGVQVRAVGERDPSVFAALTSGAQETFIATIYPQARDGNLSKETLLAPIGFLKDVPSSGLKSLRGLS